MKIRIEATWDGQPTDPFEQVEVELHWDDRGLEVVVAAPFHGDPAPEHPPGISPELWNHEVVEIFVLGPGQRYTEVELGPHGHYLVLELDGVRNVVAEGIPLEYQARIEGQRWRATARLAAAHLPDLPHRVNVCAIHGPPSDRRYLSWIQLPGPFPDFHQIDRFREVVL